LKSQKYYPPETAKPNFYFRIYDGINGEGVYQLYDPPIVTMDFLKQAEKLLGYKSILFYDSPNPPDE
jgi:hypothetical protein